MRDVIITLMILGTIPYILKKPYIGLLVYSWVGYMNPHRLTWGFAHDLPFAMLIVAVTLISLMVNKQDIKKLPMGYFIMFIWIGWFLWMNITTIFALGIEPEYTHSEWVRAIKIQFMAFLTIMLMQSKKKVDLLIWVLVISIGFYSVKGGVFTVLTAGNHIVFGPEGTFMTGNNSLAIAVLMIIPLMSYLIKQNENKYIRILLMGAIGLSAFTVVASYSRGAFLAGGIVLFYFILKSNRRFVILPVVGLLVVAVLSFMPDQYFDRLNTIQTYDEDASALGRINAWYFAYNIAKENILFGGGFGAFVVPLFLIYAPEPDDFHDAHSIYFEVLGEHGFIGLFFFLMLFFLAMKMASSTRKKIKNDTELKWAFELMSMLYISLIAFATGGAFLGLAYFDLFYHLIGLIVIVKILVDKKLAEKNKHTIDDKTGRIDQNSMVR